MNRRNFIKRSSVALPAVIVLPKLKKKKTGAREVYFAGLSNEKTKYDNKNCHLHYELTFEPLIREYLETGNGKNLAFNISYGLHEDETEILVKSTVCRYELDRGYITLKNPETQKKRYSISAKLVSGEKDLRYLADRILMMYSPEEYVKLLDKEKNERMHLKFSPPDNSDEDADCFLTTACVHYKNLPDDCEELTLLRDIRDHFMLLNKEGQALIREYKQLGPQLLQNINRAANREEILEYLYSRLVQPAVALIRNGEAAAAVAYYTQFVRKMKAAYL